MRISSKDFVSLSFSLFLEYHLNFFKLHKLANHIPCLKLCFFLLKSNFRYSTMHYEVLRNLIKHLKLSPYRFCLNLIKNVDFNCLLLLL